jgi:hypothetical protein
MVRDMDREDECKDKVFDLYEMVLATEEEEEDESDDDFSDGEAVFTRAEREFIAEMADRAESGDEISGLEMDRIDELYSARVAG